MCGLAGKIVFDGGVVTRELLERMCARLVHRGPDDAGYYLNGGVGLGHRRLSIIDLETGRQPISNEDGSVWVVFNGEIYNYIELRHWLVARGHRFRTATDTEVLVHLYEERGDRFMDTLRGMFAIALWDERAGRLLLVRDRVGKKPLYYTVVADRGLVFASELDALMADPEVPRDVDPEALDSFLSLQYIPTPLSIYRSVYKLPAAHMLTCEGGHVAVRQYWDVSFADSDQTVEDEEPWRAELESTLADAVRVRLRSDVPLGAFLSGGIDSSAVVTLMAAELAQPVVACTATFDTVEHDERGLARAVATQLGCAHREHAVRVSHADLLERVTGLFDEPFADPAAIPNYLVAEMARRHVKVALTGDGGDELFAGYWRHARARLERRLQGMFGPVATRVVPALTPWLAPANRRAGLRPLGMSPARAYAWKHCGLVFDPTLKAALYTTDFARACDGFDPSVRFLDFYNRCDGRDPLSRALYVDFKTSLVDGILVKVDRTSMAHGLEVRSPLLDQQVVEFAARVPASLKLRRRRGKHLLTRLMDGRLPPAVLGQPKHGLTTPIAAWLRGEWREVAEDCLVGKTARERSMFEPVCVQGLWDTHLAGDDMYTQHLWTLLALELWHRRSERAA